MRAVRTFLLAAALLVPTACAADSVSAPGDTVTQSVKAGPVTLVGGGAVDPEALSQDKPVALWFWAPG